MAIPSPPLQPDATLLGVQGVGLQGAPHELYMAMSTAFAQYSEIVDVSAHDSETARTRLHLLEEQCHSRGLCGHNFLHLMKAFHAQIGWERMVPDEFTRFYRFVFHLCKQPNRRHVQVDVALEAWRLLLALRFRLLDRWCDYIAVHKPALKVINEDQWRQVLEFSRSVHEDLSNYDPNGAWACFLDEFVEHLRCLRPARSHSMDEEVMVGFMDRQECGMMVGLPMSPRLGSKRRSPDVDVVLERLSAIPLPSTASEDMVTMPPPPPQPPGSASKRLCVGPPVLRPLQVPLQQHQQQAQQALAQQGLLHNNTNNSAGPAACLGIPVMADAPAQPFTFELPMLQVASRRHIRPRRSNVSELLHHTVSQLFLNE